LALCLCFLLTSPAQPAPIATPLPPQATIEAGFSPKGESLHIILKAIKSAEEAVLVAAYSFTSKPISEALRDAHRRGVKVQVVADKKGNSSQYSAVTFLANQGVPVRVNSRYAIFHHKFMVIDGRHVQTGSFNYSAAAVEKNAENVLLLRDVPELAGMYARNWEKYWRESETVKPRY
jgi:phosphatidylserine/phosphatidylglycerophosphate/cardiolipin synthase-like enzyme